MNNVSPLRYPGGKTRACKILEKIIKEHFDITKIKTLISPFFGGGSFEFYFQNRVRELNLIVNDKFTPLYTFWYYCKHHKTELVEFLRSITAVTKPDFNEYRKNIMNEQNLAKQDSKGREAILQAVSYFVINRCSFSGATLSGGFSEEASKKRFTKSSIDKIEKLDLSKTEIYNLDFKDFIEDCNLNENTLMFLDPPYYLESKSKLYGTKGDLHSNFDHHKLCEILKCKKNWILCYNNCEFIRELYSNFKIIEVDWKYSMNKNKESSEIVIVSV